MKRLIFFFMFLLCSMPATLFAYTITGYWDWPLYTSYQGTSYLYENEQYTYDDTISNSVSFKVDSEYTTDSIDYELMLLNAQVNINECIFGDYIEKEWDTYHTFSIYIKDETGSIVKQISEDLINENLSTTSITLSTGHWYTLETELSIYEHIETGELKSESSGEPNEYAWALYSQLECNIVSQDSPEPVPEPATMFLFGTGILLWGSKKRKSIL